LFGNPTVDKKDRKKRKKNIDVSAYDD